MEVLPRFDVLVRLQRRAIGQFDLEHPHEVGCHSVSGDVDQRTPVRRVALLDRSWVDVALVHPGTVAWRVLRDKTSVESQTACWIIRNHSERWAIRAEVWEARRGADDQLGECEGE